MRKLLAFVGQVAFRLFGVRVHGTLNLAFPSTKLVPVYLWKDICIMMHAPSN